MEALGLRELFIGLSRPSPLAKELLAPRGRTAAGGDRRAAGWIDQSKLYRAPQINAHLGSLEGEAPAEPRPRSKSWLGRSLALHAVR